MKAISLKLEDKQNRLLDEVSKLTRIPKSALIRKGIELVLREAREGTLSPALRQEIDSLIKEDTKLLKRLADA
jgi:predicted transcriptional regulator